MLTVPQKIRAFARRLHRDEGATVTTEWMMVIIVALIVLTAIYYLSSWAMQSTKDTVDKVEGK
jgi:hypothetical protein